MVCKTGCMRCHNDQIRIQFFRGRLQRPVEIDGRVVAHHRLGREGDAIFRSLMRSKCVQFLGIFLRIVRDSGRRRSGHPNEADRGIVEAGEIGGGFQGFFQAINMFQIHGDHDRRIQKSLSLSDDIRIGVEASHALRVTLLICLNDRNARLSNAPNAPSVSNGIA